MRNVGSVTGQAVTTAIIAGTMAARGVEVEPSKLADNAEGPAGEAFIDGWRIAFFVLIGFVIAAFAAALVTRPATDAATTEILGESVDKSATPTYDHAGTKRDWY